MSDIKQFIVSHPPFWHDGSSITTRSYHTLYAAIPAALAGIFCYGIPALGVLCLGISSAMGWELAMSYVTKRPATIGNGSAAVIGMLLAMLLPATAPWWAVLVGTLVAVILGREIFGGIGNNPFNPVVASAAMMSVSWPGLFDFDQALVNYDFSFATAYPLAALKAWGPEAIEPFTLWKLIAGLQIGGIGATFGLGLIAGGVYLILRGFTRWEISLSFLAGVAITSLLFYAADSSQYASPIIHLFSGFTLIGAFFLAPEDSSSPVNFIPMLIYGCGAGILTVLIRNIGAWVDGVILAILVMNAINPLLDKIRPKAIGKVA